MCEPEVRDFMIQTAMLLPLSCRGPSLAIECFQIIVDRLLPSEGFLITILPHNNQMCSDAVFYDTFEYDNSQEIIQK